jgi:hypothetical protein
MALPIKMSATPSSSISKSSIQLFLVSARHFNNHAAYRLRVKPNIKTYLIVWILVEHLRAYLNALIISLSVEPADC